MRKFIISLACCFLWLNLIGQHHIANGVAFFDGDTENVMPGDTIFLPAGQWRNLKIRNVNGAKGKPVIIINKGGQVQIGNDYYYGLIFEKSTHFRLTGTGDAKHKYGIMITGTERGSGLGFGLMSSDFEVDHIEIKNTGFAGMSAKTDPNCDPASWRENFTMQNVLIHDNYIHDTGGEGMYIGTTSFFGKKLICDGKEILPYGHYIKHIRIFNNIIERTGWDGIQVSLANEDCEIYNNSIRDFGMAKRPSQDNGMVIGGGTTGHVYNNKIISGTGNGIAMFGMGDNFIFNNLIYGTGYDGIFIQDKSTVKPGLGFHILHNNIINPGRDGIRMYSDESSGNEFLNNVIINTGSFNQYEKLNSVTGKDSYLFVIKGRNIQYKSSNNYFAQDINQAGFVNPAQFDFRLRPTSPLIDSAQNVNYSKIFKDALGNDRRLAPDIGMVEFAALQNLPPKANAGHDQRLTLPQNSVTLEGNGIDSDGEIVGFSWRKISGPEFDSPAMDQPAITLKDLTIGVYEFELTVIDNAGATATDGVRVFVGAATNIPPKANAGPDVRLTLPQNSVVLYGEGTDEDGLISAYQWKQTTILKLTTGDDRQKEFRVDGLQSGTYEFELTVSDDRGATASDVVRIFVSPAQNTPPDADAGPDQRLTLPQNSVILHGKGIDPDGSVGSFSWRKISGPGFSATDLSSEDLALSELEKGVYEFELTVTDDAGAKDTDVVRVFVAAAPNQPPKANAGPDKRLQLPESSVILEGQGWDSDGTIERYEWSKISGPNFHAGIMTKPELYLLNLEKGVYEFEFTVTDNNQEVDTDVVRVFVAAELNSLGRLTPDYPTALEVGEAEEIVKPHNTFSPDNHGDISTETWTIEHSDRLSACEIKVFDRTGKMVYSSRGYQTPWDGTSSGQALLPNVYYYIIQCPDSYPITGSVTLIR